MHFYTSEVETEWGDCPAAASNPDCNLCFSGMNYPSEAVSIVTFEPDCTSERPARYIIIMADDADFKAAEVQFYSKFVQYDGKTLSNIIRRTQPTFLHIFFRQDPWRL